MKKIFTLFAALAMVMSMSAATKTVYFKTQEWWHKDGAASAAYYWGTGGNANAWPGTRMTKVSGETNMWSIDIDTDKYQNIIFTRVNGSGNVEFWGTKTEDLTIPTNNANFFTLSTTEVWGDPGAKGNWSVYAPDAPKSYKDITITVVANATPKIHYWEGGDKMVGSDWENKPEMVATGEENTYSYTIKDVDEATGVRYLIVVGELQSADKQAFENVTVNFKDILPQVAVMGVTGWTGDKMTVADDYLSASVTLTLEAAKDYEIKLTVDGGWFGSKAIAITKENNSASFAENGEGNGKLTTDLAGDYVFTYTYATKTLVVTYPEEVYYEQFIMDNLVVTPMGDFQKLEASDEESGLSVTFGVYEDGSLHEGSNVTYNDQELPILSGSATKEYNADVETDLYTVRVIVDFGGEEMGLEFLMYASAPAEVYDVTVTETKLSMQFGALLMTGVWSNPADDTDYPFEANIGGWDYSKEEDELIASITVGGWGTEDPWLGFGESKMTLTNEDGFLTLTGEVVTNSGPVLNVTAYGMAMIMPMDVDATAAVVEEIYLNLNGTDNNSGISVDLYLDNYTGQDKTYELNAASTIMNGNISVYGSITKEGNTYTGVAYAEPADGFYVLPMTLTEFVPEYTDIVITDATVTIEERSMGWGDETYEALLMEGTWSDGTDTYPVLLESSDCDTTATEGTAKVSLTIGGMGDDDPWLGSCADVELAYTIADGVITLTGKLENAYAWPAPIYWNVTISGTLPVVEKPSDPTGLENLDTTVAPAKAIVNGQLVIIKNGVQYNATGAVVK